MAGITYAMARGPFTDNGASPWYAPVQVGSTNLTMKLAMDTGTNMTWVTSVLCTTKPCLLPSRTRFNQGASKSFRWVKQQPETFDYGPWGKLKAAMGSDDLKNPNGSQSMRATFGLGTEYGGTPQTEAQWNEVDWDGCIGFPSQGPMQKQMSFFYEDMLNNGTLSGGDVFLAFDTDLATGTGSVCIGDCDPSRANFSSGVFLPWAEYRTAQGAIDYLWTCAGAQIALGGKQLASNSIFGFDSGSSRFKGDPGVMATILANLAGKPDVEITVGRDWAGQPGKFVVPANLYERQIESGNGAGTTVPQFHGLNGTDGLVIVGSVMMDWLYTVYVYQNETDPQTGKLAAKPYGTWVFNKPGGPKIIQNSWAVTADKAVLTDPHFRAK